MNILIYLVLQLQTHWDSVISYWLGFEWFCFWVCLRESVLFALYIFASFKLSNQQSIIKHPTPMLVFKLFFPLVIQLKFNEYLELWFFINCLFNLRNRHNCPLKLHYLMRANLIQFALFRKKVSDTSEKRHRLVNAFLLTHSLQFWQTMKKNWRAQAALFAKNTPLVR